MNHVRATTTKTSSRPTHHPHTARTLTHTQHTHLKIQIHTHIYAYTYSMDTYTTITHLFNVADGGQGRLQKRNGLKAAFGLWHETTPQSNPRKQQSKKSEADDSEQVRNHGEPPLPLQPRPTRTLVLQQRYGIRDGC